MAKKRIVWSPRAKHELTGVLDYFNKRNGDTIYSLKLLNQLEELLDTLSQSEFMGRLTSNKKTRVVIMKVYLVFYEIANDRIEILSFWDNRQDDSKRLL